MKIALTDRYLKSLKPAPKGGRPIVWDSTLSNFGVRVTDKGAVSFIVLRRLPGAKQPARVTLGRYPGVTLGKARKLAEAALADLVTGVHPRERAVEEARRGAEELAAKARVAENTFSALAEQYIAFVKRPTSGVRTALNVEKAIRRHLIPRLGTKVAMAVRRGDIIDMVTKIADDRGPAAARQALTYASAIFNFGAAREFGGAAQDGGLDRNPCSHVDADELVGEAKARQRVLDDDEVRLIWRATSSMTYPLSPFVRLLMLTGARRNEVARMTWDEVDLDEALWTVPAGRMKGDVANEVPLSPMAMEVFGSLKRLAGDFVFSTRGGHSPISGFGEMKIRLDHQIDDLQPPGISEWVFHDLRRTVRTNLSRFVSPFIAEQVIGHRQQGVHAVYDLHRYRAEKRQALELWAAHLRTIVRPPPANVVKMGAGRS